MSLIMLCVQGARMWALVLFLPPQLLTAVPKELPLDRCVKKCRL